jgi:hypothetical protein
MSNFFKILILSLVIASCAQNQNAQEMTFEEYNPPSTLVVPKTEITKAKFPFVDIKPVRFNKGYGCHEYGGYGEFKWWVW